MAYLKPPVLTQKVFNPLARRLGAFGTETLAVRRRQSGGEQIIPVIPVERDGARYIVSTRGESEWVRNLRAAGEGELRSKRGNQRFRAVELPLGERSPVIADYRQVAGKTVEAYWKKLPDAADHPVFRVEPL